MMTMNMVSNQVFSSCLYDENNAHNNTVLSFMQSTGEDPYLEVILFAC